MVFEPATFNPQPMNLFQIDAFAEAPFTGNPAAVCLLSEERPDEWMQRLAAEMNLSETAFVQACPDGGFNLRWFTPACEVDLCGHATLASAHVLWETKRLRPEAPAAFHTRSGRLDARRIEEGLIAMDFPAEPVEPAETPGDLLPALGLTEAAFVGHNRMDVLVQIGGESAVRALRPDLARLAEVKARGVIVTAAAEPGADYDFASRFFAPRAGVPEDPVTGSAHCALAPFWAERLGRRRLIGYQVSARGGSVYVQASEDGQRVELAGRAVTVFRAELRV